MKRKKVTFPVTPEAFIRYQEAEIGMKLGPKKRKSIREFVPVINGCYKGGVTGTSDAMRERLERMDICVAHASDDAILTDFLRSVRWWMRYAWEQGRREAEV